MNQKSPSLGLASPRSCSFALAANQAQVSILDAPSSRSPDSRKVGGGGGNGNGNGRIRVAGKSADAQLKPEVVGRSLAPSLRGRL